MFKYDTSMLRTFAVFLVSILSLTSASSQSKRVYLDSEGGQHWELRAEADNNGSWTKAIVPGTVFASFVANGTEKDPNFGDNIYKVDRTKYDRNFWYRTELKVPAGFVKGRTFLGFKGINRKADIFLNGTKLGNLDGFMQPAEYDITKLLLKDQPNILTVLVYIPIQPLGNFASPTYISSAGWDWMPYVPGLNSGITDKVYLSNMGDVSIQDPWVQSKLPTNARADLSVALELRNNSGKKQKAIVSGVINPGNIQFSHQLEVDPNDKTSFKFDKRLFPQLVVNNPKLWWPNGYGEPNLYTCKLNVKVDDQLSDEKELKFGIKRYTYDTIGHVLHIAINGTKVFIKGGNWGMSEYMLRCRGQEYDTKVRLHKEMNFNMIRNWLGSTTDDEFYEACDKYGIMIWDDFWLNANPNLPRDLNVFNNNAIEKIKRFRNHPAIAVWCADNEGWPEPPLSGWLKENLLTFDGGDRYYQPNSHAENLTGSGPWANFDPRYYFTAYPSGMGGNKGWGMRTEMGTAVFPNIESFKKFMPADKLWPRNEMWNQHFFGPLAFNAGPDFYDESVNKRYGKANGIADYTRKAQLVNLETNKAMYEGWQDRIWEDASGIMTWMSQSAYPSMVWQTYDYYYDLTGAFWGAKKACEPLHIQWNPVSDAIKVVNTTGHDVQGLTAEAAIYNMNGSLAKNYGRSGTIDAIANAATEIFKLDFHQQYTNLALNRPVFASSSATGEPGLVTDGKPETRWASNTKDDEWIYVDLGSVKEVCGVAFSWEYAYAKAYKIQVSPDAKKWSEVYHTTEGQPGEQRIMFTETDARYVRMQGVERATYYGYSLYNFEVFEGAAKSEDLSDVHFIKLKLKDKAGKVVSDNFYWRGNRRKDFTALGNLPKVDLKVSTKTIQKNGKYFITAQITNPANSAALAFAIRVNLVDSKSGEQILPVVMNDNYFSLLKGETREIQLEFEANKIGKGTPKLIVESYNNSSKQSND